MGERTRTYIEEVADAVGDELADVGSDPPDDLLLFYAVLVLTTGTGTTANDVHNAWAAWRVGGRPDHESIVPFDALTSDMQALDDPYVQAVRAVARRRREGPPSSPRLGHVPGRSW